MTSSSSYVFYNTASNPDGERLESERVARVTITGNKVTFTSRIIKKTKKTGALYEETVSQQIISLHENRHGEKYLKAFFRQSDGSVVDVSMNVLAEHRPLVAFTFPNDECAALVQGTIAGWFGETADSLKDLKTRWLFPALRDTRFPYGFPHHEKMGGTLAKLMTLSPRIVKALRENLTWESFLFDACRATVKNWGDIRVIEQYPESLLPLAIIDFGSSFDALYRAADRDWNSLRTVSKNLRSMDLAYIIFMFKNLPKEQKPDAWKTLISINALHQKRNLRPQFFDGIDSIDRYGIQPTIDFSTIPHDLHASLAKTLARQLTKTYKDMKTGKSGYHTEDIRTGFHDTCQLWFTKNVLERQMKTKTKIEDVQKRYEELFGIEGLGATESLDVFTFVKTPRTTFCIAKETLAGTMQAKVAPDVFRSLEYLASNNNPVGRGIESLNGYIYNNRFIEVTQRIYSLDDIIEMMEKGAQVTDAFLTKLGRELTVENRKAFLSMGTERKFKNTWKYYDWGITDMNKILALKISNITSKEAVQGYASLPDDMFYEFLSLEAGRDMTPVSMTSWFGLNVG